MPAQPSASPSQPPSNRAARRGGGSGVPSTRSPFPVPKPGRVPSPRQWSARRT
jgi:hypothetical protein